ncbi:MAG: penicillin-binding protein 1A [Vicinamibacterales bacterium]
MSFRNRPHITLASLLAIAAGAWTLAAWIAWFSYEITARLPGRDELAALGDMAQATTIFDAADRPVFTIFKEQRIEVPLDRISPHLRRAVIAVEDQRFYDHGGVDLVRVVAAFVANLREGRRAQGGSTITQQLARLAFLSRDKTIRRKLKEVILAARIERDYSKDEILELYLNKIYFGDGLHGAEAAARGYFGKPAADLDIAEAALIAGLIKSPSAYAPTVNLDRALARRDLVLQAMLDERLINRQTFDASRAAGVTLKDILQKDEAFGLHFKEHVRRELVDRFGFERVLEGGLRVYTTLDSDMQQAAERTIDEGLREIEQRRGYPHPPRELQAALLAIDPKTGHVRAMIGGRSFRESRFNRAVQAKRQPGSAFKPFVYAAALEEGYTPASVIANLDDPILTQQGAWMPEDEHSSATSMTLRTALRTSSNRAAVQLLRLVGIPQTVTYAERLTVETPPSVPSLALGAGEVTLASLTSAYGAFANGGTVHKPLTVLRVEDSDGQPLYQATDGGTRAVSESTAFLMATMLADVVNFGTAYRARREGFVLPAAGKTGTTNDYMDAWFVGFTPSLVSGVWIGFDQPRTIMSNGYAGDLAVPLWARFMKAATKGAKPEWLERPKDVVAVNVCRMSGQLPSGGCHSVEVLSREGHAEIRSLVYTEFFKRGTAPLDTCPLHAQPSLLDRIAGLFGSTPGEPVSPESVGLPSGAPPPPPPTATGTTATVPAPEAAKPAEKEKKKRGFWSRVFGIGKDRDDGKKKKP